MPARDWLSDEERDAWLWVERARASEQALPWLLLRWRADPIAFAIECLRTLPLPYQGALLLDLADAPADVYAQYGLDADKPKRKVLAGSGHGLGKTRTEAIACWWQLLTHRFSKVLITAPTSDQLSGQLWGELHRLHRRFKARWPELDEWDMLGMSVAHKNPEYGDWHAIARTARPEKPEGLQGAHALDDEDEFGQLAKLFTEEADNAPSGGMLVIIEEASGVDDSIREVLTGALSEPGARLLGCGNPTRSDGWFARDLDRSDRYAVHTLDCRVSDSARVYELPYRDFGGKVHQLRIRGRVDEKYWLEVLSECDGDEDHDRFRVRVRGLPPRSSHEQVIRSHWVEQAQARAPDVESQVDPCIIGLDFGLTSDKHGLAVRQGFNMRDGREWLPKDRPEEITMDAAERAIDAQELFDARAIIGDANGVGRGAMEYLHKYFLERPEKRCAVTLFNSGAGALDKARFMRRRDEIWFAGRKWVSNPRCSLPQLPGMKRQLCAPGYYEDTARRIQVESKLEIKRRVGDASGNLADALLMTLVPVLHEARAEAPAPKRKGLFEGHFTRWKARNEPGELIR